MSLDTYANLKIEIADFLDRDDLTDKIDTFIDLAEEKHRTAPNAQEPWKGGIRVKEMIVREAITVDSRQISLPDDFLEEIGFKLLTNPVTVLGYVTDHEMTRQRSQTNGKPKYYTYGNEIEFDKNPDSSYSGEIKYYHKPAPLSDSNTTNDILTNYPGAYLYGALLAAAPYTDYDERVPLWQSLYADSVGGANKQAKLGQLGRPKRSRVVGSTP